MPVPYHMKIVESKSPRGSQQKMGAGNFLKETFIRGQHRHVTPTGSALSCPPLRPVNGNKKSRGYGRGFFQIL